ncbi:MAG: hypothetical protein EAY75_17100, partial [Bacteroidetes bacterium]
MSCVAVLPHSLVNWAEKQISVGFYLSIAQEGTGLRPLFRGLRFSNEKAKEAGKKVITVICAGMPLDLREVLELSDAVLYAWYPGERGGDAVADIIFGNVSPSG